MFGVYANIPDSELSKIRSQYVISHKERKQAVSQSLISDHPTPSWDLVAYALHQVRSDGSHRALEHLQQLFPTGIHVYNYCYIHDIVHNGMQWTYLVHVQYIHCF